MKPAWVREKSTTFMSTVILRRKLLSLISPPPTQETFNHRTDLVLLVCISCERIIVTYYFFTHIMKNMYTYPTCILYTTHISRLYKFRHGIHSKMSYSKAEDTETMLAKYNFSLKTIILSAVRCPTS